jgi:hypothetical protein
MRHPFVTFSRDAAIVFACAVASIAIGASLHVWSRGDCVKKKNSALVFFQTPRA